MIAESPAAIAWGVCQIRNNWNNIYSGTSPAKMYGGILIPYDVDDNGDVVYKFNEEMYKRNAEKS